MPRFTATFSFDAPDFESAQSRARSMRSKLRQYDDDYEHADTKLRKLVDPTVGDEVESDA